MVLISAGLSYWFGLRIRRAKQLDALLKQLDSSAVLNPWSPREDGEHFEAVLHKLIAFAGDDTVKALENRLRNAQSKLPDANQKLTELENLTSPTPAELDAISEQYQRVELLCRNLEVLTAIRRIQGLPDPLTIHVDTPVKQFKLGDELKLACRIENVDAEMLPVYFTYGGNYRSGRQTRWRIQVLDASGNLLPQRKRLSVIGGGLHTVNDLSFGDHWETELELSRYVDIQQPGEYEIQILYHNEATIAEMENVDELILVESEPFKIKVTDTHEPMDRSMQETVDD